jgi:hypothetical protein
MRELSTPGRFQPGFPFDGMFFKSRKQTGRKSLQGLFVKQIKTPTCIGWRFVTHVLDKTRQICGPGQSSLQGASREFGVKPQRCTIWKMQRFLNPEKP